MPGSAGILPALVLPVWTSARLWAPRAAKMPAPL
jgi:hypothetical protein